mmetsp:Transcript_46443/g.112578  ORF Transcript_46443/g.112578 Transcript_46443/m.112578 type:complete len:553 (+) Transcript_46443:105-1763(+)
MVFGTVNSAILLIDFQNEFCKSGGKLHDSVKDCIEKTGLLEKVPPFVQEARAQGATVIHAPVMMSDSTGVRFEDDKDDPQAYSSMEGLFVEGTWNAEIIEELAPKSEDIILKGRNNFSVFQGTKLKEILKREKIKRLFIAGLLSNVCISNTVNDAGNMGVTEEMGVEIFVLKDGCAAETMETHQNALELSLPLFSTIVSIQKAIQMIRAVPCSPARLAEIVTDDDIDDEIMPMPVLKRNFTMFDEIKKLRIAMCDKWIAGDRFVRFLDRDADGQVDYDEFYDFLHQFGIAQETKLNVRQVFDIMDTHGQGSVPVDVLLEAFKIQDSDFDEKKEDGIETLPPFPSPFLVGLVAHNNMKPSMMKFVKDHLSFFSRVKLVTTGSTGRALSSLGLDVEHLVSSGPLGGDQEIGGLISEGKVCAVFFFTDPLSAHPHSPDIAALNRICCVHDCMFANNPSSAELLVFSLEHSAFGYSRLTGLNPTIGEETDVVGKYKEGQAKVIQAVSAPAIKKTDTLSTSYRKSVLRAPRAGKTEAEAQDRASSIKATRKSVMFAR